MDVRRLPKNPSTASFSSTGGVEREVQEEDHTNNHSKQINNLVSSFTPPELKPISSSLPKSPISKTPACTATTVEKRGDEPKDGGGGEGSEAVVVEDDGLQIPESKRDKKRKAKSKKPGKEHGEGKDGAAEEPEEEDVQVNAVAEKQKQVEADETKERNKKKKKTKDGAAEEPQEENVQVHAVAEKQKQVEADETKERNKKKKTKVGNADSVSENLIEQLTKSFGIFRNEETKKAIQSMEPSKKVSFAEEFKNLQIKKTEMLLKEAALVREFAEMISKARRSPTS